jgi:arylsulfatase A-like enzyme
MLNMRSFRACFAAAAILLSGVALAAPRPNIVLIMSDDMGYSDIGCYGGEIQTPNLDKLAAGGVRFTQFYNTARCCPTRASLVSGLYPHQAGVGHMMEDRGLDAYRGDLNKRCATIAEVLRPAGYGTYAVGKWHVTRHVAPAGPKHNWPLQRGFDRYYGTITGAGSFYDPGTLTRDNTMISPAADKEYQPKQYYYTDAISDHAARFIADHHRQTPDKPLFVYAAYTAAHWPMHALEEDIAKYKGRYDGGYEPIRRARFEKAKQLGLITSDCELSAQAGEWNSVENKAWEARCMEVYAAMIDRMDAGIGRIVAELQKTGRLDNTLIFFLQDNGGCAETVGRQPTMGVPAERPDKPPLEPRAADFIDGSVRPMRTRDGYQVRTGPESMPGPYDTFIAYGQGWANVSNSPFREYKHWVHEGGISTPLIVHWPAGITRRGELERQPGHLIDIMATCVDLAGATYPPANTSDVQPLEGRSLAPTFSGQPIEREAIYWEHEGNRAIRVANWKLVAKGPAGPWELYDIDRDRAEQHDLAAQEPNRVKQMTAQWETWAKRSGAIPWIWQPAYGEPPGSDSRPAKGAKKGKGKKGKQKVEAKP